MNIELNEIKYIRKKFGLTQTQLANLAQVSQSLIAKIESGRLDPTYSNAQKIFSALNSLKEKHELKAKDISNKKIIYLHPNDEIKESITKMKKYGISQLPVIDRGNCVGLVSDSILLDSLLNNKGKNIKEIMEDSPPIVSENTSVEAISNLLRFSPMVLVSSEGKLTGIITKSDVLSKIYTKEYRQSLIGGMSSAQKPHYS